MRKNDDLILEQLYQEGIWDRLKGQGAGIKQGAGTLLKNVGGKLTGDTGPRQSARVEYAKAQQSSLLKSFVQKVQKEIADFKNDLKLFKVETDPNQLEKNWPIIAQRLKEISSLEKFLTTPTQPTSPTQSAKPSTAQPTPSTETPETPKVTTNVQDYLDLKGAAEYLKISETELQNKAATGKIKSTIIGGKPLFKKEDLDGLNKPEAATPEAEKAQPVSNENTPKKGDKVTYNNDPNYEFDGSSWVYKGTEIKSAKLTDNLNKAWAMQQKTKAVAKKPTAKPTAKAVAKKPATKTTTKAVAKKPAAKAVAKKPATKTTTKAVAKKPTAKPAAKATKQTAPKKAAIKPRKVVNASYNPFGEFLKECNLI